MQLQGFDVRPEVGFLNPMEDIKRLSIWKFNFQHKAATRLKLQMNLTNFAVTVLKLKWKTDGSEIKSIFGVHTHCQFVKKIWWLMRSLSNLVQTRISFNPLRMVPNVWSKLPIRIWAMLIDLNCLQKLIVKIYYYF